jgi:hypothetical protein
MFRGRSFPAPLYSETLGAGIAANVATRQRLGSCSPNGYTEGTLRAYDFTVGPLAGLVRAGLGSVKAAVGRLI